jgi:hypothetical protein
VLAFRARSRSRVHSVVVSRPASRFDLWFAAAVTYALSVGVRPAVAPDGVEMAAAGRCLWKVALNAEACAGLEPFFWMPAFPLLSGFFAFVLEPRMAAHAAGAAVVGLMVLPLAHICRRLGAVAAAPVVAGLLLAVPAVRELVSDPTGRGLAVLALIGAGAVASGLRDPRARPMRRALAIGGLVGLAMLSRREAVLPGGLLLLGLLPVVPRVAVAAGGAALAVVAPWLAVLSWVAGSPRLGGRLWEAAAFEWDAVVPHDWLLMELSMGSWGAPLRRAVAGVGGSAGLAGLDLSVVPGWLAYALPIAVPAWV